MQLIYAKYGQKAKQEFRSAKQEVSDISDFLGYKTGQLGVNACGPLVKGCVDQIIDLVTYCKLNMKSSLQCDTIKLIWVNREMLSDT